jgi:hypothetical protein
MANGAPRTDASWTWAQEEMRSVNGQIEYLLTRAVNERKPSAARDTEERSNSGLSACFQAVSGNAINPLLYEIYPQLPL